MGNCQPTFCFIETGFPPTLLILPSRIWFCPPSLKQLPTPLFNDTYYVIPNQKPPFDEDDPRWIGAWWMGPPIIGLLIFLCSLIIMLFPQKLPKSSKSRRTAYEDIDKEVKKFMKFRARKWFWS